MKNNQPSVEMAEKIIGIRKRAKRGEHLSQIDAKVVADAYKTWPKWYTETESRVFNETAPFGSLVRKQ